MADDSPKRTYSQMETSNVADEHSTPARRYQSPLSTRSSPSGYDSPRSMVAERMRSLELRHDLDMDDPSSPSPRKKSKIRDSVLGNIGDSYTGHPSECTKRSSSPSPRQGQAIDIDMDFTSPSARRTRYRSPPPLILGLSSSSSGTPTSTDDSSSPTELTWKFAEITGARIDVPAGDDGEGINGIGFRPSAQVAYARKQRRKQQVSDWKLREARDARQRRFEKRQGCKLHDGTSLRERSVRFAELL